MSPALTQTLTYRIGQILSKVAVIGDSRLNQMTMVTPFHSKQQPQIPVVWYYVQLSVNAGLYDEQSILVLILIERLCNYSQARGINLEINSLTIHR